MDYGVRYEFVGPTYTTGQYHQYYFLPNAYNTANAVRINTAANIPGQAPTQGSIITGSGNPYNGMIQEGTNGLPKGGLNARYNNFGPRLGFAFDVFGDGKTALQSSSGLHADDLRRKDSKSVTVTGQWSTSNTDGWCPGVRSGRPNPDYQWLQLRHSTGTAVPCRS